MDDLLAFASGLLCGLFSGMIPGLHPNTTIAVLSSMDFDPRAVALMIIALYPAHMIVSFIPSIFFGIPDRFSVVTVLPGQRMVLEGKGLVALKTALFSCLLAAILSVALFVLSLQLYPEAYGLIRSYMGYILLAFSLILLAKSRDPAMAALVFIASGLLGEYALNTTMYDPFLPLFSGMFAMAAIVNYRKREVPEQKDLPVDSGLMGIAGFVILGVLLGMVADLLPGVGSPSQIATFTSLALPIDTLGYLSAISSISVSQTIFSFSSSASIGKSRVGATAWLAESMDIGQNLPLLLVAFMASMAIAVAVVYALRNKVAKLASLDFAHMNAILAFYLVAITLLLDGLPGLLVLALGTALGWATLKLGVERTTMMGAVIVPTLLLLFRVFVL